MVDEILDWAAPIARAAGYAGTVVVVSHRAPLEGDLRANRVRGVPMVCVASMLVARAREGEDLTRNRADFSDATIIGRLTAELRCYVPYAAEGPWLVCVISGRAVTSSSPMPVAPVKAWSTCSAAAGRRFLKRPPNPPIR